MEPKQLRDLILKELPTLMQNDPTLREAVLEISRTRFADKTETENRFDHMMALLERKMEEDRQKWEDHQRQWEDHKKESRRQWEENQKRIEENQQQILALSNAIQQIDQRLEQQMAEDRQRWAENQRKWEENERKWEENQRENERKWEENQRKWEKHERRWEESQRKWEESQRKWEENERKWEKNQQELMKMTSSIQNLGNKYDQTLGALGARWGIHSEVSFRNALAGILKEFEGVEVVHVNDWDEQGVVFGHPDQVELDVIIKNGLLMIGEIKSSLSKSDLYSFERKVRFYEQKYNRQANRLMVISPMVDPNALPVAKKLGMEVYSYVEQVTW